MAGPGPGRLALYKVAQKIHVFQFLEISVPWSVERWVWEFSIAVLQVWVGSPAGEAGSGPPPRRQPLPPRATHRWRSTVCSASVLRRRWEGAAGSRGGPGPVGRQGRLRLGSSPRRASSDPLTRSLDWAPVAPRLATPPSLEAQVWLPVCSSRGCCRAEGGAPGATSPTSVLLQTRPCPGSHRAPREAS